MVPRLCECRQSQAKVVSNSRNKIHQTWGLPFTRALYSCCPDLIQWTLFPLIPEKLVVKDGREWCLDVLDRFVAAGQSVSVGEAVVRRYRPVSAGHNHVVLGIYSSDSPDVQVILLGNKINRT